MRYKIKILLLIYFLFFIKSPSVRAEDVFDILKKKLNITNEEKSKEKKELQPIEPFGGIKWSDSFVEVIDKINKIEGLDYFYLVYEKIDLKYINIEKEVEKKMYEFLLEHNSSSLDPNDKRMRIEEYGGMIGEIGKYKNIEGTNILFYTRDISITAYPIVISNVPFKLEAIFIESPGLELKNSKKVVKDSKVGYRFPLVLTQLRLISTSPNLRDNYIHIDEAFKNKYKDYELSFKNPRTSEYDYISDSKSLLKIESPYPELGYLIVYSSHDLHKELDILYYKNLSELETNSLKKSSDMKDKL